MYFGDATDALAIIGIIWLSTLLYSLVYWIYKTFLARHSLAPYKHTFNGAKPWALITGANGGLGSGFAHSLASQGFNLILAGRSQVKLAIIEQEIRSKHPSTEVRIWLSDASKPIETNEIDSFLSTLSSSSIPLTLLINNVGINMEFCKCLAEEDLNELYQLIQVNCIYSTQLTAKLIPYMLQSKGSQSNARLGMIHVSSMANYAMPPYLSPYAASKAYNYVFSRSLHAELSPLGFDVLAFTPAVIASNLSGQSESFAVASPLRAASAALASIRFRDSPGYWVHALQTVLATALPVWLLESASRSEMKKIMETEAREKGHKKAPKQAANSNSNALLVGESASATGAASDASPDSAAVGSYESFGQR